MENTNRVLTVFRERLGKNLRYLRIASGTKVEIFAKKLGLTKNHLYRIENATAARIPLDALYYINREVSLNKLLTQDVYLGINYKEEKK